MYRRILLGAALTVAFVTGAAGPAAAAAGPVAAAAGPAAGAVPAARTVAAPSYQTQLDAITAAGMPGVFAEVRAEGGVWRGASGVADVETGRPMRPWYQHRVGSITKTFVATALLQVVGEGRLALDAPIGRYLPEFAVEGVTVRMLLNHTSGIADYDTALFRTPEDIERYRTTYVPPRRLVEMGLAAPRTNPPGAAHAYSNTNYVLAGLILERVTGRPAEFEISRRILWPLGLWQTYFPGRLPYIIGPHSKGYVPWLDGQLRDFSVYNMSIVWMAGDLISTARDLDRFYAALLTGRLLRPAEQAEMLTTVPFDPAQPEFGGYGLGIFRIARPCGGEVWGHNGVVFGYWSMSLHTPDASQQVTLAMNMTHYAPPTEIHPIDVAVGAFLTATLCGSPAPTAAGSTRSSSPLRLPHTGLATAGP